MSPAEEKHEASTSTESDLMEIPVADIVIAVWQRRLWLIKVIGIGTLVSLGLALLAFFIPNEYSSVVRLMPPDSETFSTQSMLSLLSGPSLASLAGAGGGLFSNRSPGTTAIGVLASRTVQDDIINRLDLRRIYHEKLEMDARKELEGETKIDEDKKTGIISITVTNEDKYLARNIAQAYVDELNTLISSLSTSSARRERIFLEGRLKAVKADLDASSLALSQFSSRNATLDPAKQGEATAEAASKLQGELITVQSELSSLKAMYTDDNVRVRALSARAQALRSQLEKMSGEGVGPKGSNLQPGELFPSVRQLPLLGYTYYDLFRQVTIDESIYETLRKQYEIAKVQEAKEIPRIEVLDPPDIPEKQSWPHRSLIAIFGFLLTAFGSITWTIAARFWEMSDESSALKQAGRMIIHSLRNETKPATSAQQVLSGLHGPGTEKPE